MIELKMHVDESNNIISIVSKSISHYYVINDVLKDLNHNGHFILHRDNRIFIRRDEYVMIGKFETENEDKLILDCETCVFNDYLRNVERDYESSTTTCSGVLCFTKIGVDETRYIGRRIARFRNSLFTSSMIKHGLHGNMLFINVIYEKRI